MGLLLLLLFLKKESFFGAEAFAVVREAARRKLGMRHFDVQVNGFISRFMLGKEAFFYFFSSLCGCGFNDRLLVGQCFMMDQSPR